MLVDDCSLPGDLDYSPVPPVDADGQRPCSKLSERLSALREHRRSQYRLSQHGSNGVQSEDDRASLHSGKSGTSLHKHSQKELRSSRSRMEFVDLQIEKSSSRRAIKIAAGAS